MPNDLKNFCDWKLCRSEEETIAAARELATTLSPSSTIAQYGELGAGKTTFVRGLAEAFGILEAITSPSYNICVIYDGKERRLIHVDAYRLNSPDAAEGLMLEDFMRTPYCLVMEWAENLGRFLPPDAIHISFEIVDENIRRLKIAR